VGNISHPITWGGRPSMPAPQRPVVRNRQPSRPAPPPQRSSSRPATPSRANGQTHDNHRRDTNRDRVYYSAGSYVLGGAYGWNPYYGYGYPYYCRDYYPVVPPPAVDFTGLPEDNRSQQRATNAQSVALAQKFIGYGDALFAQGKYADANDRYRTAAESAPQLPDALFRQAFALAATGRYDLAVRAVKRGLDLDPRWPSSGFTLDELYKDNAAAKSDHLESLAAAAQKRPNDADLVFLMGVYFYFDGQAARAAPFFRVAAQLAPGNADYIAPFMAR
jgi:tetratricopeptide (TPR) repeat protein